MLDNIKNNSVVICNSNYKIELLKSVNKLINIKFLSMNEFIKSYLFDYDEKTILYLIKNYNISYEIALEYINNLYYIEDKLYNNEKLDYLVKIKKELIDNNLLIFNNRFKKYIKNEEIIIYNYNLSKFDEYVLKDLNVKIIDRKNNNYTPVIYEFNDIEEEIEYVAIKISELINSGVSIDKIKLTNVNKDYINLIHKIFNFYNLKINRYNNLSISSTVIGSIFLNNLDSGVECAVASIDDYKETDTYNKIINVCNKYVWCEKKEDLKLLITYELNNTKIDNIKYTNMIEVVDYQNYPFTDEFVFMLGFNQGIIPIIYKDEDYLTDSIKPSYLDSVVEKNKKEKEYSIKCIKNIKNLIITYKLKSAFNTFYPSNLIDELNVEVKKENINYKISYSDISNEIRLASMYDDLIKFGKKDSNINLLSSNYNIPYNTYRHDFTGISKDKIKNYISKLPKFYLSYSSMDNYNKCAFRFYVEKILKLKDTEEKFSVVLGNLYHYILELALKKDIDVTEEVYKYIQENNIELTNSNKFFVDKSIDNIKFVLDIIKKHNTFSNLDKVDTEKKIEIPLKDNIYFLGFIDKILYNTINNQTIASIIDYKTYVKKPSLKYIESGIGLQLPTYMYLAKNEYKNIRFAGFYLQNILLDNKDEIEKEKSLKLIGYSNLDKDVLKEFDSNYMDSSVIEGIKTNNDGSFNSNSMKKMLTDEQIDKIISITQDKINETIDNVLDSKFDINPKYDNGNIGCEFCKYKDLCFMKEYDFKKIEASDVFGGELNE